MASLASDQPNRTRHPGGDAPADAPGTGFTPLEQSIIRLARIDRLWTVRHPGRLRRLWNGLLGRGNPRLANARLEALRKAAVLAWHHGPLVPLGAVADFLSAGFTREQYEQLLSSVQAALGGKDGRP